MSLELSFGALSDPIRTQLDAQNVTADRDEISHWQRDADAIVRVAVRGLLPDSQIRQARKRLLKRIAKGVSVTFRSCAPPHGPDPLGAD